MIESQSEEEENNAQQPKPKPKKVLGVTLVSDAYNWRKWWSMKWMVISGAMQSASQVLEELIAPARAGWSMIPADWLTHIPAWVPSVLGWAAIVALAAAGVSRVVQQRNLQK